MLRLTKLGHSCVRVEGAGVTVVVDPGAFSDPDALAGADAVLVTHEHFDHVVPGALRAAVAANPGLRVWTNPALAATFADLGDRVVAVRDGETFDIGGPGGVGVRVHGEKHAVIHPDLPVVDNVGFAVAGAFFHPGDALTVPDEPVPLLLAPLAAPWLRMRELADHVRAVAPERVLGIHDAILGDEGVALYTRLLANLAGQGREVRPWAAGEKYDVT